MHPLNGKIFLNEKTSSLIWTKGAEMHTHFCGFQRKNFYSVKRSPHLFGIAKSNDTLFLRKNEKIFFQLRDSLLLLAPKVPSLIWNWKVKTQPVFRKIRKIFEKIVRLKKYPSLVFTGRGCLGTVLLKKQKICPPVLAGIKNPQRCFILWK